MLSTQLLVLASAELATGIGKQQTCKAGKANRTSIIGVTPASLSEDFDSVIYSLICTVNVKERKARSDHCNGTLADLLLRLSFSYLSLSI